MAIQVSISHKFLQHCNDTGSLKHLAFFIRMKYSYGNSCIINKNLSDISKEFKCSRTKMRRHLLFFAVNEWTRIHEGNIVFNPFHKIIEGKEKYSFTSELHEKSILSELHIYFLKQKQQQCLFARDVRSICEEPSSLQEFKKAKKLSRLLVYKSGERTMDFQLSIRRAATLYNCSMTTAWAILKDLVKKGLIFVKRNIERLEKCGIKQFKSYNFPIHSFLSCGYRYQVSPSTIVFLRERDKNNKIPSRMVVSIFRKKTA